MNVSPFNNRIGIKPRKIGPFHEQLVYASFATTITALLSMVTFQSPPIAITFLALTVTSIVWLIYILKNLKDWSMRHAKTSSRDESNAHMMVRNEL